MAASTTGGTEARSCVRSSSDKLSALRLAPERANCAPPWNWLVPVRVIMLKTRPPRSLDARSRRPIEVHFLKRKRIQKEGRARTVAFDVADVHAVDEIAVFRIAATDRRSRLQERRGAATSTWLITMTGLIRAADHMSNLFGSVWRTSTGMTVCLSALVVPSSGASPVTVTPSDNVPICSFRSARAVPSALTMMFSLLSRPEPLELRFHDVGAGA